jgi:hypothetical protein
MKLFLLFLYLQYITSNLPDKVSVRENQLNIVIDASHQIGKFHEKVYYSLELNNNELKNVSLKKFLPQIDSDFFDVKVKSKDVNILKYELSENKDNFNKNNKILNIVFEKKDNNYNQGNVMIDYEYSLKNFGISEKEHVSEKSTFYLKDISLPGESTNNSKFFIEINNLPNKMKLKRVNFQGKDVDYNYKNDGQVESKEISNKSKNLINNRLNPQENKSSNINRDSISLRFSLKANPSTDNKLKIELEREPLKSSEFRNEGSPPRSSKNQHQPHVGSSPAPPASSKLLEPVVEYKNGKKITTYYYYKEKHSDNKSQSFLDSLIVFLIVVCVCFYCCCSHSDAPKDQHDPHQNNNPHDAMHNNPDGFYTY